MHLYLLAVALPRAFTATALSFRRIGPLFFLLKYVLFSNVFMIPALFYRWLLCVYAWTFVFKVLVNTLTCVSFLLRLACDCEFTPVALCRLGKLLDRYLLFGQRNVAKVELLLYHTLYVRMWLLAP